LFEKPASSAVVFTAFGQDFMVYGSERGLIGPKTINLALRHYWILSMVWIW